MCLNSLHLDPAQLAGNGNASSQVQHLVQSLFAPELINRGTAHLAGHGHLRSCRRNQNAVTGFNMDLAPTDAL